MKNMPVHGSDSLPDVIYILSPSYSGSTLLTFLLATHPDISTVGELKASAIGDVATYKCSCSALLTECPFWTQVRRLMDQGGLNFGFDDFGTHFRRGPSFFVRLMTAGVRFPQFSPISRTFLQLFPPSREWLTRIVDQNCNLIRIINQVQGGRVFLDGSKDPERLDQLLYRLGGKLKVVRLLRDGRGVSNSFMKHYGVPMSYAVKEVLKKERSCENAFEKVDPRNRMLLRYDEMCKDPTGSLSRIFKLAGLDPDPKQKRTDSAAFHILGNAMRLDYGQSIKIDEKWRRELTPSDLECFNQVAGKWNAENGFV